MAATQIATLTDFLLARIAEDEADVDRVPDWHCTDSVRGEGWGSRGDCPLCGAYSFDGTEDVTEEAAWDHLEQTHRRTRVLAECEAKRRIAEFCQQLIADADNDSTYEGTTAAANMAEEILEKMAPPYADHPDFNEAWRP